MRTRPRPDQTRCWPATPRLWRSASPRAPPCYRASPARACSCAQQVCAHNAHPLRQLPCVTQCCESIIVAYELNRRKPCICWPALLDGSMASLCNMPLVRESQMGYELGSVATGPSRSRGGHRGHAHRGVHGDGGSASEGRRGRARARPIPSSRAPRSCRVRGRQHGRICPLHAATRGSPPPDLLTRQAVMTMFHPPPEMGYQNRGSTSGVWRCRLRRGAGAGNGPGGRHRIDAFANERYARDPRTGASHTTVTRSPSCTRPPTETETLQAWHLLLTLGSATSGRCQG